MAIKNTARYMANSPMLTPGARQMMSKMGDTTDKFPGLSTRVVSNMLNATKDIDDEEERKATLNELYRAALPIAQNNDRLDERDEILNQKAYEISQMQDGDQKNMQITALKLGDLSNKIKRTYSDQISADADDNEVLNQFIAQIPDGQKMLENYLNNGDKELLYAGGLATKQVEAQGGGIKSLVNNPSDQKVFWEKETDLENFLDMMNLIGEGAETVDNVVNKYIPTITGEKAVNNLADRINNLSDEEIAQLRKQYSNMINAIEDDDQYTAGEILSDLGTTLGYYFNPIQRLVKGEDQIKQEATEAVTRFTQARKKDGKGWEISKKAAMSDKAFKEWLIDNQATFGEYMIGANETLQGINSPNVVKFFSNIPGSAVKTFTATVRGMTNPYDTLSGLVKLVGTKEGHQALLQRYGSWDAIANTMNTDPVGFADDILSITQMAGGLTQKVGKLTGLKGVENFGGYVNTNIGSATDALAGKTVGGIYGGIDNKLINNTLGKDGTANKYVSGAGKYLEGTSNLGKAMEYGKEGVQVLGETSAGQAVKNWRNEMINKIVGIDEKDRKFIQDNKELVNDYVDGKKNVNTVYDTVKDKLSDKALEKTEMGKQYDQLAQNKNKVVDTQGLTNDKELMNTLKKNGISVDADGNLVFDKINEFSTTQQKALQDAWQVLKDMEGEKKLDAGQTLGQRKKMDNKINREGKPEKMSSSDIDTEKLIKRMRATLDGRAKEYIVGLKELDAEYNPLIDEVKQMKKDRFNPDGTLKDNAKSKLRNLTKAGNEEKLARLEKIAPGITQDLKALDVGLTVEKATKQGVGQYSKGAGIALGIGQLLKGNIPGALASIGLGILATPKNFVRVIEVYPDIVQKLSDGVDLTANEISKLQDLSARIGANVE